MDLKYFDQKRSFEISSLWSPLPQDVERNMRLYILDQSTGILKKSRDIDLIILGFGLWSIQPKNLTTETETQKRYTDFENSLPQIVKVTFIVPESGNALF